MVEHPEDLIEVVDIEDEPLAKKLRSSSSSSSSSPTKVQKLIASAADGSPPRLQDNTTRSISSDKSSSTLCDIGDSKTNAKVAVVSVQKRMTPTIQLKSQSRAALASSKCLSVLVSRNRPTSAFIKKGRFYGSSLLVSDEFWEVGR